MEADYSLLQHALNDVKNETGLDKLLHYKKAQDHQAKHDLRWQQLQLLLSITPNKVDVLHTQSGLVIWTRGASWTRKISKPASSSWIRRLFEQVGEYHFLGNAHLVTFEHGNKVNREQSI
jgi:hypothetical protein